MAHERIEAEGGVRTPVTDPAGARPRSWEERALVRFPRLVPAVGSVYLRIPPSSRLRRALTVRNARRIAAAFNRRDLEVVLQLLDPQVEFEAPPSAVGGYLPPDMPTVHRGHDGYTRMFEGLLEVWDDLELQPQEVIDFGDRVLIGTRITGHGRQSGIALEMPLFQVVWLGSGLIVRQRDFADRSAALDVAGSHD